MKIYKLTKPNKVKSGACYVLPDTELGWPEMQADHRSLWNKEKCCKNGLITTHPYHKRKTQDHRVYLVKVKINPSICFSPCQPFPIETTNRYISSPSRDAWSLSFLCCDKSLQLCLWSDFRTGLCSLTGKERLLLCLRSIPLCLIALLH